MYQIPDLFLSMFWIFFLHYTFNFILLLFLFLKKYIKIHTDFLCVHVWLYVYSLWRAGMVVFYKSFVLMSVTKGLSSGL